MTSRVSAAEAELDDTPWCPHCEGAGCLPVKSKRGGTYEMGCPVCSGKGVVE